MITDNGKKFYSMAYLGSHQEVMSPVPFVNVAGDEVTFAFGQFANCSAFPSTPSSVCFKTIGTSLSNGVNIQVSDGSGEYDSTIHKLIGTPIGLSVGGYTFGSDAGGAFAALSVTNGGTSSVTIREIGLFMADTTTTYDGGTHLFLIQYLQLSDPITLLPKGGKTLIFRFNGNELTM